MWLLDLCPILRNVSPLHLIPLKKPARLTNYLLNSSCGTITIGDPNTGDNTPANPAASMCQNIRSVGNFCQTTPYLNKDGSAAGETIFVATDCTHNWPAAFCFQQAAYLQQGVAANASVYNDYVGAHWDGDINSPKGILSTAQVQCEKGNWPPKN